MFQGATALADLYKGTAFEISDTPSKTFWTLYSGNPNYIG
jgi:hypothetical protein